MKYFSIEKPVDRVHRSVDRAAPWSIVDHGQGRVRSSLGDATRHQSLPQELLWHEEVAGNLSDRTEGGGEA
jgi:hypothetical protein